MFLHLYVLDVFHHKKSIPTFHLHGVVPLLDHHPPFMIGIHRALFPKH
jgi:hypothetical protein